MKITCSSCGRVITRNNADIENDIRRLEISKEDYVKIYLCRHCRSDRPWLYGKLNWGTISQFPNLPLWFIDKYKDKIDWTGLLFTKELPEEVLEKYIDKINNTWYAWDALSQHQNLSPRFILKYLDKIKEAILRNRRFNQLPDSIKLLLIQKFKGGNK
jgi:hypothetical protein